ncbi:MAG: AsmA family protein [Pseudomonadota bacterium]
MVWIFRLIGIALILLIFFAGALFFLPKDRLAGILTDQLSASTGRETVIAGDVSLSFWPTLGLRAEGFSIANPSWASAQPMFEADSVEIAVEFATLLGGDLRIKHVAARSPAILVERDADGRLNWNLADDTPAEPLSQGEPTADDAAPQTGAEPDTTPARATQFAVEHVSVTDARVTLIAPDAKPESYSDVSLEIAWPAPSAPAEVEMSLKPADVELRVEAVFDAFGNFLAGDVQALTAKLSSDVGQAGFDGRAGLSGAFDGAVTLETPDVNAFLRGLSMSDDPSAGSRLDVSARLIGTPDLKYSLRNLVAQIDSNQFEGDADVTLAGVPRINAKLRTGALDLSGSAQAAPTPAVSGNPPQNSSDAPAPSASHSGWSKTPIDASALALFDGDIELRASSVDLSNISLGATHAILRNENARMVFELVEVAAYGGSVKGEFVINNRDGLSVGGRLSAPAIALQPLLADTIDFDRLSGTGALQLSFLGVGNTLHAIMNSLSGDGSLSAGNGEVSGINLDQLIGGGAASGTTVFEKLSATWTINNGILSNDDMQIQLKRITASGKGTIGLGAQNIDYTVIPEARRIANLDQLAVPIKFKGPWSDVSVVPDVEEAVKLQINKQLVPLKLRAADKLLKELGVEPGTGLEGEARSLIEKLLD